MLFLPFLWSHCFRIRLALFRRRSFDLSSSFTPRRRARYAFPRELADQTPDAASALIDNSLPSKDAAFMAGGSASSNNFKPYSLKS